MSITLDRRQEGEHISQKKSAALHGAHIVLLALQGIAGSTNSEQHSVLLA